MATLTCEFEMVHEEGRYICYAFGLGAGTEGLSRADAIAMCVDYVRGYAQDFLVCDEPMPSLPLGNEPKQGGSILVVSVDTSLADVPAMSSSEAARALGLSRQRVAQLCDAGLLESWRVGATRMVSVASVEARKSDR